MQALDGLRGVAILFVMLFHYVTACGFGADSFLTRKIVGLCVSMWTGVDIFFVLSGFLITGILLRAKAKPGYFKNFYMRRLLRIFPLYYGALVVLFVLLPRFVAIDSAGIKRVFDAQGWLWAYSEDLAIVFHNEDFFDPDWLWVGHFWSLGVEEHFYLVWPVLVSCLSRRGLFLTALGLVVATPLVRIVMLLLNGDFAAVYTFTLSRTDELAVGGLVAILAQERSYEALARYARFALAGSGLYLASVIAVRGKPFWWGHWTALGVGFSALAAGAAGLLILALSPEQNLLKRALESRLLGTFGKYSYGAYVIHAPLEPLCLKYLPPQRLADMSRSLGHTASQLIGLIGFTVFGIGATMALSILSFFVYERPFIRLKRYFEYDPAAATQS